jgi:hypothetical protein
MAVSNAQMMHAAHDLGERKRAVSRRKMKAPIELNTKLLHCKLLARYHALDIGVRRKSSRVDGVNSIVQNERAENCDRRRSHYGCHNPRSKNFQHCRSAVALHAFNPRVECSFGQFQPQYRADREVNLRHCLSLKRPFGL